MIKWNKKRPSVSNSILCREQKWVQRNHFGAVAFIGSSYFNLYED